MKRYNNHETKLIPFVLNQKAFHNFCLLSFSQFNKSREVPSSPAAAILNTGEPEDACDFPCQSI